MRSRIGSLLSTRRRVAMLAAATAALLAGVVLGVSQCGDDETVGPPEVPEATVGGVSDTDRLAFVQLAAASQALDGFATQLSSVAPDQRSLVVQQLRPTALNLSLLRPRSKSLRRVRATIVRTLESAMKGRGPRNASQAADRLRATARESRRLLLDYARGKPTLRTLVGGS